MIYDCLQQQITIPRPFIRQTTACHIVSYKNFNALQERKPTSVIVVGGGGGGGGESCMLSSKEVK